MMLKQFIWQIYIIVSHIVLTIKCIDVIQISSQEIITHCCAVTSVYQRIIHILMYGDVNFYTPFDLVFFEKNITRGSHFIV